MNKKGKNMDYITLILIALGLAADAFAVSVTNGMCSKQITKINALLTGITFGFFQGLMPFLGFFLGRTLSEFVYQYQHWVALFLLCAIGLDMLVDAAKDRDATDNSLSTNDVFTTKNLLLQGIATSIDAFAVGVSFAVLQINIYSSSLLICAITFFCCFVGVYIGRIFGSILGLKARFLGGIVLLLIGFKIFVEHQFF